jgi:CDP-paratose 2-epimerase
MANSLSLAEATELLRHKFGRDIPIAYTPEARRADQTIYITDNRKAERVLGWQPRVGISEGYDRIMAWIQENEDDLRLQYGAQPRATAAQ